MWKIPKIWEGGRCFILGGGASLPKQFNVPEQLIRDVYVGRKGIDAYSPYLSSIQGSHIIGVNMAYRFGNWVDCVFWGDDSFLKRESKGLMAYQGIRVTCANKLEHPYHRFVKHVLRDRKQFGLTTNEGTVVWNKNSGAAAINLATQLGVKQIILLGFDMKLDAGSNQHWHKCYSSPVKTVGATFKRHLTGFPAIAEDAKKLGVEILNCNLDSAIDSFKKVSLKDIL